MPHLMIIENYSHILHNKQVNKKREKDVVTRKDAKRLHIVTQFNPHQSHRHTRAQKSGKVCRKYELGPL